jgi:hypothetical protein
MKTTMAFFDKELFVGIRGSADNGGTVNEDLSDQLVIAMADFGLGEEDDGDDDGTAGADEDVPQHPPPARCRTDLHVISKTEPTPEAVHSQPSQRNTTPGPSRQGVTTELHNINQNDGSQLPLPLVPPMKQKTRVQAGKKGKEKATG